MAQHFLIRQSLSRPGWAAGTNIFNMNSYFLKQDFHRHPVRKCAQGFWRTKFRFQFRPHGASATLNSIHPELSGFPTI